jgi:hypothetical protein
MPERRMPVRNVIGCNMSFRRDVFRAGDMFTLGLGRERGRPSGCEETEFCIRALRRHRDSDILYEPAALVHHRVPPERASWQYFRRRCMAEGISKAQVARAVGARDALATERAYVRRALSRAVLSGLAAGVRGEPGVHRAAAVVGGLVATSVGYARGSVRLALGGA